MKIKDLNNGTIDLIEVSETRTIPPFGNRTEVCTFDDVKIETKIYTDGVIERIDEPVVTSIKEHFIDGKKYTHKVDKMKRTTIHLKDYTYAVVYTIGEEFMQLDNICGNFRVTKLSEIYLKDRRDRIALRKAKKTMSMVANNNRSINTTSLLSYVLSQPQQIIEYEKQDNVYTLKR